MLALPLEPLDLESLQPNPAIPARAASSRKRRLSPLARGEEGLRAGGVVDERPGEEDDVGGRRMAACITLVQWRGQAYLAGSSASRGAHERGSLGGILVNGPGVLLRSCADLAV